MVLAIDSDPIRRQYGKYCTVLYSTLHIAQYCMVSTVQYTSYSTVLYCKYSALQSQKHSTVKIKILTKQMGKATTTDIVDVSKDIVGYCEYQDEYSVKTNFLHDFLTAYS